MMAFAGTLVVIAVKYNSAKAIIMATSNGGKTGFTTEKLALYDDVITGALVDKVGDYTAPIVAQSPTSRGSGLTGTHSRSTTGRVYVRTVARTLRRPHTCKKRTLLV
jgi:hypothetical protein